MAPRGSVLREPENTLSLLFPRLGVFSPIRGNKYGNSFRMVGGKVVNGKAISDIIEKYDVEEEYTE